MSRALPVPPLDPEAPLAVNARRVLIVRVVELFSYAPIIPDATATEALHNARIATKRLRYTLELFRAVFGDEGERIIEHLKEMQEELGQLHDHDVRIAIVERELAGLDQEAEETALVRPGLDGLLKRERTARARRHTAVVKRWRRLEADEVLAKLIALASPPVRVTS